MFEFIFEGTPREFERFKVTVEHLLLGDTELRSTYTDARGIHCKMRDDPKLCFQVGMVLSNCYQAFEQEKG